MSCRILTKRPLQHQNQQAIANNLKSKSSCIHVFSHDVLLCFRLAKLTHSSLHRDCILVFDVCRVKTSSKKLQCRKQGKKQQKRTMTQHTKRTAHGLTMMSFIFAPAIVSPHRTKVNRPINLGSNLH